MPLYIAPRQDTGLPLQALDERYDTRTAGITDMSASQISALLHSASGTPGMPAASPSHGGAIDTRFTRRSLTVNAGSGVSLCSYFNAFPASYWRAHTGVRQIRLLLTATGSGVITLFKSNCRGLSSPVGHLRAHGRKDPETLSLVIPLTGVVDGGWVWFEADADAGTPLTLSDASWQVPSAARKAPAPGMASIVITTFNRERYCLRQLSTLAAAPDLLGRVSAIRCIDQGTRPVSGQPGFPAIRDGLGEKLQYIRQRNLGGSGGFSRGMIETLDAGDGSSALLLDDDAIIEPESLLRAIQFEDYVRRPTIVGAGMLHLDDRSVLYTQAERFDTRTLLHEQYVTNHDFAVSPLASSPALHRRVDSGYNGWWMSLIPAAVMRKIGFALPCFLKFDDIDYSARAAENGFPTVSLPGVAIWHQAWHGKNESRSWQEYYNQRNRYMYALLHCGKANRHVPMILLRHCTGMGLGFIYSGIALDRLALKDLLRGPEWIVRSYSSTMGRVNEVRSRFADTKPLPDDAETPVPVLPFTNPAAHPLSAEQVSRLSHKAALDAWLHPRSGAHDRRPGTQIDSAQAAWQALLGVDSALVAAPDGNSEAWLRRDDRLYRHLTARTIRLAVRLVRRWGRLHQVYCEAHLGSRRMWEEIFAQNH